MSLNSINNLGLSLFQKTWSRSPLIVTDIFMRNSEMTILLALWKGAIHSLPQLNSRCNSIINKIFFSNTIRELPLWLCVILYYLPNRTLWHFCPRQELDSKKHWSLTYGTYLWQNVWLYDQWIFINSLRPIKIECEKYHF